MSIEQSVENILGSVNLGGTGAHLANFIVHFAEDLSKLFSVMHFLCGAVGFFLFVWALLDLKAIGKANNPSITGGGTIMKIIFSSVLGTFSSFMKMSSMSLFGTDDPTSPLSYVDKAMSVQSVSPFVAMVFAVFSIITLIGWFYGMKSVYLFATVNGKQDKESHVMQAAYMLLGSTIMVNLSVAVMGFFESGGVSVENFGNF